MEALILFYQLLIGHAVGDFVLQPSPMSAGKNRQQNQPEKFGEGFPPWYYWLGAHSLTHAGIVYLITSSVVFALIETASHFVIDHLKCERNINLHQDQILHISFKALYCVLFWIGWGG